MSASIRVLHVDDDPDFADLAVDFLEREDRRLCVETASGAAEGLDRLAGGSFDCVVSDYDMPKRNGIEFLEGVRADYPDLPFILFTGKGSEEIASEAISAGVTDYLQKESGTDQYAVLANRIVNAVEGARAQRERRRHLGAIETAEEGISILEDGHFIYVDEAYADLYGYEPEELVGEHWELLYPDEDAREVQEEILPIVDEKGSWRGETTGLRADGSTFVEDHTLSRTDGGELICTVRDVTDHRERERELERYGRIVETAGDSIYVLDSEGRFEMVNDRLVERTGYDRDRLLGSHVSALLPESDVETGRQAIHEVLENGAEIAQFEATVETADGRTYPVEVRTAPLVENGEMQGSVGISRDVTDRRERERRMTELHETTRRLMDADDEAEIAAITADASENILDYPNTVVRLLEDGELRPVAVTDGASDELGDRPVYPVGKGGPGEAYGTGEPLVYEDVTERDDEYDRGGAHAVMYLPVGEYGTVSIADTDPGAFDHSDIELAGVLTANTEAALRRVERESRLRDRERELEHRTAHLEELIDIVSHDLRSPLNVAAGRVALAREDREDDHLGTATKALDRIGALVDDLLALAREGGGAVDRRPVDLAETAEACWANVPTGGAALVTDTERTIAADPDRLRQLLENLFGNAVRHGHGHHPGTGASTDGAGPTNRTDGSGSVTVTVGDTEGGFYVEDDGVGIPTWKREEVFGYGHTTAEDGTGLGLSIVRGIAGAHDWEVRATESEGGGARFEITGVESVDD